MMQNAFSLADYLWKDFYAMGDQRASGHNVPDSIEIDVPGVNREHLELSLDGLQLILKTKKDAPRRYHYAYQLSRHADFSQIKASLRDGVVSIKIPAKTPLESKMIAIE